MDALGCEDLNTDSLDQWHQGGRRGAHPVGECRHVEINAFPSVDRALPVERQMQAILGEQDMGEQFWAHAPARNRVRRDGRLADRFTGPAGELLAHMLDHFPLAGDQFQRLGHVLADFAQSRAATARVGSRRRIDDALPRQMLGQRITCPAGGARMMPPLSSRSLPRPPFAPPSRPASHPPPSRRAEARADRAAIHAPRIDQTDRAAASGS
jgi:hypothetical protein